MDNLIRQFSEEIDEASETLGSGVYNKLSDLSKEMHDLQRDKLVEITYMVFMPVQKKTMNGNIKIVIMKTIKKAYFPLSKIKMRWGDYIEHMITLRQYQYSSISVGKNLIIKPYSETKCFCLPDNGDNNCDDNDCYCGQLEVKCPESILLDMKFVN
jgi:hypothetical protein